MADREFAGEVRSLAAQLRLLAEQQKRRLDQAGDRSADREIAQINKALAEAERSLSNSCTAGVSIIV